MSSAVGTCIDLEVLEVFHILLVFNVSVAALIRRFGEITSCLDTTGTLTSLCMLMLHCMTNRMIARRQWWKYNIELYHIPSTTVVVVQQ